MSTKRPFSPSSEDSDSSGAEDTGSASEDDAAEPTETPYDDALEELDLEEDTEPISVQRVPRPPVAASTEKSVDEADESAGEEFESKPSDLDEESDADEIEESDADADEIEETDADDAQAAGTGTELESEVSPDSSTEPSEDSEVASQTADDPVAQTADDPAAQSEKIKKPAGAAATAFSRFQLLSAIEKASLIVITLVCISFAVALFTNIFGKSVDKPEFEEAVLFPDFPREGERITISSVAAYWVKPGDRTVAPTAPKYIPEIEITLSGGSGKGNLRVEFFDDRGANVGDTEFLEYANGKFVDRSSATTTKVHSTDGPGWDAFITAYKSSSDVEKPWSVKIFEVNEDREGRETPLLWQTIGAELRGD